MHIFALVLVHIFIFLTVYMYSHEHIFSFWAESTGEYKRSTRICTTRDHEMC